MPYSIIHPPFTLSLREMPEREFRRYYQWFMDVLPERITVLASAIKETSGFESWLPDYTPASLDTLGQWFSSQIETRSRTQKEIQKIEECFGFPIDVATEELTERTLSLAMDIGMYLSQVFLKNNPSLKWSQPLDDKKFVFYGQPVLTGFGKVELNPVDVMVVLARGLADQTKTGNQLRELFDVWSRLIGC